MRLGHTLKGLHMTRGRVGKSCVVNDQSRAVRQEEDSKEEVWKFQEMKQKSWAVTR